MNRHFYVYKTGRLTVVGFAARHLAEPESRVACRDELLRLIDDHACEVLVVDLMDVDMVSTWVLGVLAAVRSHGIDVELYHPSAEVREVLAVTHLDDLLHVRHDLKLGRASAHPAAAQPAVT